MEGGYTGRLMVADLTRGTTGVEAYPEEFAGDLLGGFGVNNRLFTDYSEAGTDPLPRRERGMQNGASVGRCMLLAQTWQEKNGLLGK